ncbi:MAG TPA: hypothetical protein DCZ12_02090 [Gammaproteobacteria bacterium]|nr:hypothetical protein [Gammaproteobacteria bacterium]
MTPTFLLLIAVACIAFSVIVMTWSLIEPTALLCGAIFISTLAAVYALLSLAGRAATQRESFLVGVLAISLYFFWSSGGAA